MNALLGDQQAGIQVDQKRSLFCQKLVIELAVNEERLVWTSVWVDLESMFPEHVQMLVPRQASIPVMQVMY
jgi:hypothetical protein